MNRIGIRLGGKAYHERGRSHEHQARVPWAVKQMREDLLAEQDKQHWRNTRNRVDPDYDEEGRPPPCVGICYYNKLQALQEKEDMTNHNEVYKQPDEPCDGDCNVMDEEDNSTNVDNNIIVIDEDAHSDSKTSDQPE